MSTIAVPIDAEKITKIHQLAGQGRSNKAIAQELSIGETTVRKYRRRPNGEPTNGKGHPSSPAEIAAPGPGARNGDASDVEITEKLELERLLTRYWQEMPLIRRVKLLLDEHALGPIR